MHAWQAGPETTTLRSQLLAMPSGGTFVMTIPASPYRCPPGPYERACVVADWLKRNKPGSKVIVLDANPGIQAERHTFETAFTGLFAGIVEYVPNAAVKSIDTGPSRIVVDSQMGTFLGDVVNAIPPQRAGKIVLDNGLANSADGRWAGVKAATFESTAFAGVHVIGDSCSAGIRKPGTSATRKARPRRTRSCARSAGSRPTPTWWSIRRATRQITASTGSWLTALYQHDASMGPAGGYRMVGGARRRRPARRPTTTAT